MIKINDIVVKKDSDDTLSYKVIDIKNGIAKLKCLDYRFYTEFNIDNLNLSKNICEDICENDDIDNFDDNYFVLPGRVLHIDSDDDYLIKSMKYYKSVGLEVIGLCIDEINMFKYIYQLLVLYNPNVLVITGHDSYIENDLYENSSNFSKAIKEARKFERDYNKLIIIAGACQSNFELLISSGANFASSPKRVNIHALDPAIIASSICFSKKSELIDLFKIINKTKFGFNGIGGIVSNGVMYIGMPKNS